MVLKVKKPVKTNVSKRVRRAHLKDISMKLDYARTIKHQVTEFDMSPDFQLLTIDKKGNNKVRRCEIEPHTGTLSFMNFMTTLDGFKTSGLPPGILNHFENLILLAVNIQQSQKPLSIITSIMLYLKSLKSVSIFESCILILQDLNLVDRQGSVIEHQSGFDIDWLALMDTTKTNWKLLVNNVGFTHLQRLFSMLVAAGFCSATNLQCNVGSIKLFSIKSYDTSITACDFIDAIFQTSIYFIEGGYRCFLSKSFMPLIYSDTSSYELESEFCILKNYSVAFAIGSLLKDYNVTENDYSLLLDKHLLSLREYVRACTGFQKSTIHSRILAVEQLKNKFITTRISGSLKIAPYTIELFGGSGVGKSSVGAILMNILLRANNYDASPDRLMVWKEGDKYDTTMRNHTNGIFMDDVANTKTDYVERPATATIIQTCNNVPSYAVMADIDQKGKVTNEAKVVIVSTNKKDLDSSIYSNCPLSILRRMHEIITVIVRPEFVIDGTNLLDSNKVSSFYDGVIPAIPDLWKFDVERAIAINSERPSASVEFETALGLDGNLLKSIDIFELIKYTTARSCIHFKQQTSLVADNRDLTTTIPLCLYCTLPMILCQCPTCKNVVEPQFGHILGAVCVRTFRKRWFSYLTWKSMWETKIEQFSTQQLINGLTWLEQSPYSAWTNYVPSYYFKNEYMLKLLLWCNSDDLKFNVKSFYALYISCVIYLYCVIGYKCPLIYLSIIFIIGYYILGSLTHSMQMRYIDALVKKNDAMPLMFKNARENYISYFVGAFAGLGFIYLAMKLYSAIRIEYTDGQSNLSPVTESEIVTRNEAPDIWLQPPKCGTTAYSEVSKTTTPERAVGRIQRNLVQMRFHGVSCSTISNGLFLRSNLILIPKHMWEKDEYEVTLLRDVKGCVHSTMKTRFSRAHSYDIPHTDLSVVYAPGTGDWKDLISYLPLTVPEGVDPCILTYRDLEGELHTAKTLASHSPDIGTMVCNKFQGSQYNLPFNTFKGLCIAPLITDTKVSSLVGFHLGGITNSGYGVSGTLLQQQVLDAITQLSKDPSILVSLSSGVFPSELYGVNYGLTSDVHVKSPLRFLDITSPTVDFVGNDNKRSTMHSSVEVLCTSDSVANICGKPNIYGPPPFYLGTKIWRKNLIDTVTPALGVPAIDLRNAVMDYSIPLLKLADSSLWKNKICPLTDMETLSGKDGVRFIDAMKPNTSIGYPLTGPKSNYLTILDPSDDYLVQHPVELDKQFWDEAKRMEESYVSGIRTYPVFKGCLKDEVTKASAVKVRVFNAGPVAFQLVTRKYFLPIAHFLSMNPLLSECAVGINCYGPEWDEMHNFITRFGDNRILAGDYSAYDKRAPAQMMLAAFNIFINLAKQFGYDERALLIMRGIATDTTYSINSMNGDVVRFCNSNPSGNNLTVYLNCIMNSLWFRCGYYATRGIVKLPFRKICHLMTYGDDAISSVAQEVDGFNHITFANYLRNQGMIFTMPNKIDEPTKYMLMAEADFLKRKSVFSVAMNQYVGALDENSIFKSLHASMKSKILTNAQVAAGNIDGALREWFYHGPEIYEHRRTQMKEVAEISGISHICRELDLDYSDRVSNWQSTYVRD